jgi:hypothetical protein
VVERRKWLVAERRRRLVVERRRRLVVERRVERKQPAADPAPWRRTAHRAADGRVTITVGAAAHTASLRITHTHTYTHTTPTHTHATAPCGERRPGVDLRDMGLGSGHGLGAVATLVRDHRFRLTEL